MLSLPQKLIDAHKPIIVELDGVLLFRDESNEIFIDESIVNALQKVKSRNCKIFAIAYNNIQNIDAIKINFPFIYKIFDEILEISDNTEYAYQIFFEEVDLLEKPCVYLFGRFLGPEFWLFAANQNIDAIGHPEEFGSNRWIDLQLGMTSTFWPNNRENTNGVSVEEQWLAARLLVWIAKYACDQFSKQALLDVIEEKHSDFYYSESAQINAERDAYVSHFFTNPVSSAFGCLSYWNITRPISDYIHALNLDADNIIKYVMQMDRVNDQHFTSVIGTFTDCFRHDADILDQILPTLTDLPPIDEILSDFERAHMIINIEGKWEWTKKFIECYRRQPEYWREEYTIRPAKYDFIGDAEMFFEAVKKNRIHK